MPQQVDPLKLLVSQFDQVLHFKKCDRHAIVVDAAKMLSGGCFEYENSCPVIGNLVKASGIIRTNPEHISCFFLGACKASARSPPCCIFFGAGTGAVCAERHKSP